MSAISVKLSGSNVYGDQGGSRQYPDAQERRRRGRQRRAHEVGLHAAERRPEGRLPGPDLPDKREGRRDQ